MVRSIMATRGDFDSEPQNDSSLSTVSSVDPDEFDLVENPSEELHCSVCLSVFCNPNLTSCCGNHFCQECIERIRSDGRPCPLCQSQDYTVMLDKSVMRRVKQLRVRCPNKDQGCMWVGELGESRDHMDSTCDFVAVTCSFHCGTTLPRCRLSDHKANLCYNRPYVCPYCDLHAAYAVITEEHLAQCASYPVECLNGCEIGPIKRKDLPMHLRECPLEVIECEFSVAGCGVKVSRKEMPQHLKESVLSHVALIPSVCSRFAENLEIKGKALAEKLEIKDKALAELRSEFVLKQRAHERETHNLQTTIQLLQGEIQQLKKRVRDVESETKLPPTVSLLQGEIRQLKTKVKDVERQIKLPPIDFVMKDFQNHLYWEDQWFSEPFYTHERGYKMCLSVFANGIGQAEGEYISVFANVTRGEFDDELDWPFQGYIEVEMDVGDNECYEETFKFTSRSPAKAAGRVHYGERNNFGQGCSMCIPHDDLSPLPSKLRLRVCSVTVNS